MTLGPVIAPASLVTLKIPAPIRIPISAAYDSMVPRSRRSRETIGADSLVDFMGSVRDKERPNRHNRPSLPSGLLPLFMLSSIHSRVNSDSRLSRLSQLPRPGDLPGRLSQSAPAPTLDPSRCVRAPICHHENERPR